MDNLNNGRSAEEVARLGDEVYERAIRPRVERDCHGKVVAIDVNSEEYEIGENALAAASVLLERVPDAEIWVVRVGHRTLHRIGHHALSRFE
jgi:hypothetical protein